MNNRTNPFEGLSQREAEARILKHGTNEIGASSQNVLFDFLARFKNPLVLTLLGAALLSGFFGDALSALLIIVIVVASGVLDFFNSYRAQRATELLQKKVRVTTAALRDGILKEIPVAQVVPGDVIRLLPGDVVPADGRVLSADDLFINESALTGESFPAERRMNDHVLMGSNAITGNGWIEVETTGRETKFGLIAESLAAREAPTEFDRGIRDFSYLIMRIMFVLVIFVFFVNAFSRHSVLESFLFATALAVGLTPELLPMIITLNLTKGSLTMEKHGVIVKKLSAIQNCGSMDILCTDKTGTLTEDKIAVVQYVDVFGKKSETVLWYAYLNSIYRTALKNPLDEAIAGFRHLSAHGFRKTEEIPFDFLRRRDSIVVANKEKHLMITKGAPEGIFEICTHYGPEKEAFGNRAIALAQAEYERLSSEGFRVLGVATKEISHPLDSYSKEHERVMTFQGFVAFLDPPKKTAAQTLKLLTSQGIEVKVLTGDNELVTSKIASEIRLPVKGVATGAQIALLSDDGLRALAKQTTIFARVTPDQKTRIIRALQSDGHAVGYLGDGINDAPSLKAADVGISVNNAVDIAKESADLILLHKNLRDLANGISEGRRTFVNTLKYLKLSLSSNFGNMFSMAAASVFVPFFPMLPVQILLNNLLSDVSQFALPLDTVDDEEIGRPRKLDTVFLKKFMLVFGPLSSCFDFLTFFVLFFVFQLSAPGFQTGWFLESIITQTFVVWAIRTGRVPFFKSKLSLPLVASTCFTVVVAWGIALSSIGQIFKFTPLSLPVLFFIGGITVLYLVAVEMMKRVFHPVLR